MSLSPIIVLEGPDFAGKSTLSAGLAAACGATIVPNGPPPATGSIRQHYADQIERAASGPGTVFDRLHIGELIYGPELRGQTRLSEEDLERLEGQLTAVGAVRVHVDVPDAVLLHRLAGPRGDDLIREPDRLLRVAGAYRRILTGRPYWQVVDGTSDTTRSVERILASRR